MANLSSNEIFALHFFGLLGDDGNPTDLAKKDSNAILKGLGKKKLKELEKHIKSSEKAVAAAKKKFGESSSEYANALSELTLKTKTLNTYFKDYANNPQIGERKQGALIRKMQRLASIKPVATIPKTTTPKSTPAKNTTTKAQALAKTMQAMSQAPVIANAIPTIGNVSISSNAKSTIDHLLLRRSRFAASYAFNTADEIRARYTSVLSRSGMTEEQRKRAMDWLEGKLQIWSGGGREASRAGGEIARMMSYAEARAEKIGLSRIKWRDQLRKRTYRNEVELGRVPGANVPLATAKDRWEIAKNIVSSMPSGMTRDLYENAMRGAEVAFARGDISQLGTTADRIIRWNNENQRIAQGKNAIIGIRGKSGWEYGGAGTLYLNAQNDLAGLNLDSTQRYLRESALDSAYDDASLRGNPGALRREAQRIENDKQREASEKERRRRITVRAQDRNRMRGVLRPIGGGKFGDVSDIVEKARASVRKYASSPEEARRLFSDISYIEQKHAADKTMGTGSLMDIIRTMEKRKVDREGRHAPFSYKMGGQYRQWTPESVVKEVQNALTNPQLRLSPEGGAFALSKALYVDNLKSELDNGGSVKNFRKNMQGVINDIERAQRKSARYALASANVEKFLGVERFINPMDKDAMHSAIKEFEEFAKALPSGSQFKRDIEAFRWLNDALGTTPEDQPYRDMLLQRMIRAQGRAVSGATPRTWYRYRGGRNSTLTEEDAFEAAQQYAQLQEVKRTNYSYRMKTIKNAWGSIAANLLPINPFLMHEYTDSSGQVRTDRASWFYAPDQDGKVFMGLKSLKTEFKRRVDDIKFARSQLRDSFFDILSENPAQFLGTVATIATKVIGMLGKTALYGGGIAAGVYVGAAGGVLRRTLGVAEQRTQLRNLYNISVPNAWKNGRSYEQFEQQSFKDARMMRSDAYLQQANAMRLAMATGSAKYVTGENAGKPIITSFDQIARMSRVLTLMARVTGADDATLEAWAMQLQQAIGKGAADIMDIKPMENRSIAMTNLWAQKALGLSGAPEMFAVMERARGRSRIEGITPEKFLPRMTSPELERELLGMLRSSARTWSDVATIVKSDLKLGALSYIEKLSRGSGGDLGNAILGMSQAIAEDDIGPYGKLGDLLESFMPQIEDLPMLINEGIHKLGELFKIGGALVEAGGLVASALMSVASAAQLLFNVVSTIVFGVGGLGEIVGNLIVDKKQFPTSWSTIADLWRSYADASYLSTALDIEKISKGIAGRMTSTGDNLMNTLIKPRKVEGATGDTAANISAMTDTTGQIAQDTKDIKKNGAKLTSIQLELLKQVSGRAVVNNVTRVAPNIVANVGTIKSGVEYEQFMSDLNKTVRLATLNMAY